MILPKEFSQTQRGGNHLGRKWIWALILVSFMGYVLFASQGTQNQDVLRLHIKADSNSEVDQAIKLEVRDSVLQYINKYTCYMNSKSETQEWVEENLDNIVEVANTELSNEGVSYKATAKVGRFDFPDKQYGDKVYPAGEYDALQIMLGSGQGHNWWCVLFPPLCLIDLGISPDTQAAQSIEYKSFIWQLFNG